MVNNGVRSVSGVIWLWVKWVKIDKSDFEKLEWFWEIGVICESDVEVFVCFVGVCGCCLCRWFGVCDVEQMVWVCEHVLTRASITALQLLQWQLFVWKLCVFVYVHLFVSQLFIGSFIWFGYEDLILIKSYRSCSVSSLSSLSHSVLFTNSQHSYFFTLFVHFIVTLIFVTLISSLSVHLGMRTPQSVHLGTSWRHVKRIFLDVRRVTWRLQKKPAQNHLPVRSLPQCKLRSPQIPQPEPITRIKHTPLDQTWPCFLSKWSPGSRDIAHVSVVRYRFSAKTHITCSVRRQTHQLGPLQTFGLSLPLY